MSTLVIYHSADLDGLCSREVARHELRDTALYLGWDYGQPVPDLTPYTEVYLIDISLPPEVMRENAAKLIWIDHHKSAIEANKDTSIRGYRIDGVAACRLAWQWFMTWNTGRNPSADYYATLPTKQDYVDRKVVEPYAVRLLGEYDIWNKTDASTDLFQLAMLSEKAPDWELLMVIAGSGSGRIIENREYLVGLIEKGRAIQAYTEVTNAQISTERGFDVVFEGLTFRALCTARCNSMTFTAALKPHHDGCLAYHWNGRAWRFSLYHAPGKECHDLSKIATKYGGGGHKGACGFEMAALLPQFGGQSSGAQG